MSCRALCQPPSAPHTPIHPLHLSAAPRIAAQLPPLPGSLCALHYDSDFTIQRWGRRMVISRCPSNNLIYHLSLIQCCWHPPNQSFSCNAVTKKHRAVEGLSQAWTNTGAGKMFPQYLCSQRHEMCNKFHRDSSLRVKRRHFDFCLSAPPTATPAPSSCTG